MANEVKMTADAPVSMHPDILNAHAADLDAGPVGKSILGYGKTALAACYQEASLLRETDVALRDRGGNNRGDKEHKPGGGLRLAISEKDKAAYQDGIKASLQRAGMAHDTNRESIITALDVLQRDIDHALRDPSRDKPSRVQAASDLRAIVRDMKPAEAMSFLHSAIEDGEMPVYDAVMSAHPAVSGLTKKEVALLREMAERKFAPDLRRQLEAGRKILEAVERAGSNIVQIGASLVPPDYKHEQQSRAALARLSAGVAA